MSKRVLVLEDEAIVAMDIAQELEDAGWDVVGPAGSLEKAEELAEANHPYAALLDINVSGKKSFGLASRLRGKGIDVVFLTGYAAASLPEEFAQCAVVSKPVNVSQLVAALDRLGDG